MDSNAILSRLEKLLASQSVKILESGRFGRAELLSVWIEAGTMHSIAPVIRGEPTLKLDWLENLSVAEIGDSLLVSWFLRSRETSAQVVLRSSIALDGADAPVDAPSVKDVWPMAEKLEKEVSELFGIRFKDRSGVLGEISREMLPQEPRFPMRKSYVVGSAEK